MTAHTLPHSASEAMLDELAALGMRAVRVVVRFMEIEQAAADVVAGWLPAVGCVPSQLGDAIQAGRDVDGVTELLASAVPRVEGLARALDRLSRSVRRTAALRRRIAAGWTGAGPADNRAAMVRRQVGRGVAEAIRREADGEAAERLFDELAERLDDAGFAEEVGALPVEEVVRRICRDLGLAMGAVAGTVGGGVAGVDDTG